LSCKCINMSYRECIYGEVLIKSTDFGFWCTPRYSVASPLTPSIGKVAVPWIQQITRSLTQVGRRRMIVTATTADHFPLTAEGTPVGENATCLQKLLRSPCGRKIQISCNKHFENPVVRCWRCVFIGLSPLMPSVTDAWHPRRLGIGWPAAVSVHTRTSLATLLCHTPTVICLYIKGVFSCPVKFLEAQ
jgi:hypothetical protein